MKCMQWKICTNIKCTTSPVQFQYTKSTNRGSVRWHMQWSEVIYALCSDWLIRCFLSNVLLFLLANLAPVAGSTFCCFVTGSRESQILKFTSVFVMMFSRMSRMLNAGACQLAVGGRLVFCTHSMNPIENEAVVANLLIQQKGFCRFFL